MKTIRWLELGVCRVDSLGQDLIRHATEHQFAYPQFVASLSRTPSTLFPGNSSYAKHIDGTMFQTRKCQSCLFLPSHRLQPTGGLTDTLHGLTGIYPARIPSLTYSFITFSIHVGSHDPSHIYRNHHHSAHQPPQGPTNVHDTHPPHPPRRRPHRKPRPHHALRGLHPRRTLLRHALNIPRRPPPDPTTRTTTILHLRRRPQVPRRACIKTTCLRDARALATRIGRYHIPPRCKLEPLPPFGKRLRLPYPTTPRNIPLQGKNTHLAPIH